MRRQSRSEAGDSREWIDGAAGDQGWAKQRGREILSRPLVILATRRLGLGNDCLNAGVQATFVTAGGVLVQSALLDSLVEDGDGGAVDFCDLRLVASGEGLAHEAERAAKLGLVGAVDGRLGDGLTGALERGYVICHGDWFFLCRPPARGSLRDALGGWCARWKT